MIKLISGIGLMVIGVLLGLYVGGWVFFVGGIAGLIDVVSGAVNGNGISGMDVAVNVVKIMFAGFAGWVSVITCWLPSYALMVSAK